ncbi:hypothetical protein [Jeotgalibacillus salarius]|uniref:Abortive phage infection protein n=1 Tax=Jeotgalibacillus salarius TaxID=546023 RepID=A0A4Y8LIE9_9BACL|nr:hypothetical protein [Jeotgalibacillus salarius]TFE00337.1 hypothetical protein E2626_12720 [Jeotgalibacillus salarius]
MNKEEASVLLDQLKSGELAEIVIEKENFDLFRSVLLSREDFKHFRGIARHHGKTVYQYQEEARS